MDSFYTEHLSVTSPQPPDERVMLMGDFDAMVGSVRSEAIGGVGAETESKNCSRFRELLDRNSMCAIDTFVGDGGKTWYGNGAVKAFRNDFICCHKSLLPSVVSCRILDGVELSEEHSVSITEHWPFLFTALFFICKPARRREFARMLLPRPVELYMVMSGGKKPSSSACHVLFRNTSKLMRCMLR